MDFLFGLGSPPLKISHYAYANIPKSRNNQIPKYFLPQAFQIKDTSVHPGQKGGCPRAVRTQLGWNRERSGQREIAVGQSLHTSMRPGPAPQHHKKTTAKKMGTVSLELTDQMYGSLGDPASKNEESQPER